MKQSGFLLSLEALISLTILLLMLSSFTHILGQNSYIDLVLQEKANSIVMQSNNIETAIKSCKEEFPNLVCSNVSNNKTLFKAKKYLVTESGLNKIELYISRI